MQAPEVEDGVDGYRNFLAVAEWYRLATPFTQWFTKNYCSNYLPLAHSFEVAEGHVPGLLCFAPCGLKTHVHFVSEAFARMLLQVCRKSSYKGSVRGLTKLPVDGCTVLGILVMFATMLPTQSLNADSMAECVRVLQSMEQHMHVSGPFCLLPSGNIFRVEVKDNHVHVSRIQAVLKELNLSWSKLLGLSLLSVLLICHSSLVSGLLADSRRPMSLRPCLSVCW